MRVPHLVDCLKISLVTSLAFGGLEAPTPRVRAIKLPRPFT